MKKYVLIEVANREINHWVYESLSQAKLNMYAHFNQVCIGHNLICVDDEGFYVKESECWINDDCTMAYANTDNHQFDWKIIEI